MSKDTLNPVPQVGPMEPLVQAGFELIPLHRWDKVTVSKKSNKTRPRGKSPVSNDWTTRFVDPNQTLKHVKQGGNAGVRLRASELVIDIDPRNLSNGLKTARKALMKLGVDPKHYPVVKTGSGGMHIYMEKPADVPLLDHLPGYPGIEFKSRGRQVVAPGSIHPNGTAYTWLERSLGPNGVLLGAPDATESLLKAARRKPKKRSAVADGLGEHSAEDMAVILASLDPLTFQDHDRWLKLMMACHHASAGAACEEFVEWSIQDPLYADDATEIENRWDSLRRNGIGLGTLYMFMREAGCLHLIQRRPDYDFPDDLEELMEDRA